MMECDVVQGDVRSGVIRGLQTGRLRLLAYVRSLVGDVELAEDIFQEVSVIALEKAESFDPDRDLGAWLRGIARNLVRRTRSTSRRQIPFPGERFAELVDTAFQENRRLEMMDEKLTLLRRCMNKLASGVREMLRMRYACGMTFEAIAERSGRSHGAVQVALSRTRRAIAECVERAEAPRAAGTAGGGT